MGRLRWERCLFIGITAVFIGCGIRLLTHRENKSIISEDSLGDKSESVSNKEDIDEEDSPSAESNDKQNTDEPERGKIFVHVDGQVNKPGLYEFYDGDRVEQAIEAAGGLKSKANLSGINLAMKLQDEMKIYVPNDDEEPTPEPSSVQAGRQSGSNKGKININKASIDELVTLPSIGPGRAQDIIDYRETGPFKNLEELKQIPGIGDKTFEKLKDKVCLK